MAEYTFVDIFATKGIEYLVVLLYFILFVVFTKNLESSKKSGTKPARKD